MPDMRSVWTMMSVPIWPAPMRPTRTGLPQAVPPVEALRDGAARAIGEYAVIVASSWGVPFDRATGRWNICNRAITYLHPVDGQVGPSRRLPGSPQSPREAR